MKKISHKTCDKFANSRGVTAVELIIVLLLIGLLAAFAIPQLISSRRMMKFAAIQQQLVVSLREARQLAMSQRRRVTLQYDDTNKLIRTFELPIIPAPAVVVDVLGPPGDARNRVIRLTVNGLSAGEIVNNAPAGAPTTLGDTSTKTDPLPVPLPAGVNGVNITFNPRGDAVDAAGAPTNTALFFYNNRPGSEAAFAVSILGPGGRVRIWRYNGTIYE
jgi:prepilin-type N-terminal cleavage/methylation domain-containing protein